LKIKTTDGQKNSDQRKSKENRDEDPTITEPPSQPCDKQKPCPWPGNAESGKIPTQKEGGKKMESGSQKFKQVGDDWRS